MHSFGGVQSQKDSQEPKLINPDIGILDPNQLPTDTVQVLRFNPTNSSILAAGCWDETVRIYQLIISPGQKGLVQQLNIKVNAPVMDMVWSSNGQGLFVSTGDPNANLFYIPMTANAAPTPIGVHQGVVAMSYATINNIEVLITVGANKQLTFWMNNGTKFESKASVPLSKYPNSMDFDPSSNLVMIGMETIVGFYPLERLMSGNLQVQEIDPQLKSTINCVAIRGPSQHQENLFKNDERTVVACGSDGRAWVGYVNLKTWIKKD